MFLALDLQGWIYRQICESVRPLHPQILEFLETYATNALAQTVGLTSSQMIGACGGCVPFTEAELFSQFSEPAFGPDGRMCAPCATDFVTELDTDSDDDALQMDLTPQLLFLYYMFYIHHQELASQSTDNRGNQRECSGLKSCHLLVFVQCLNRQPYSYCQIGMNLAISFWSMATTLPKRRPTA